MTKEKYALLDTDFISKTHLIQKDDQNKLIDRSAFAAYYQSYARWKEAQEHINSEGATYETENGMQRPNPWVAICNTEQRLMMQETSEFGLTPSARSRIMAASGVGKDEEDEKVLGAGCKSCEALLNSTNKALAPKIDVIQSAIENMHLIQFE